MKLCLNTDYATLNEVEAAYPAAAAIAAVEGGWLVFESQAEHEAWLNQV